MRSAFSFLTSHAIVLTSLAPTFILTAEAVSQTHGEAPVVLIDGYATDEMRTIGRPARSAKPISSLLDWFPVSHRVIRQMIDRPYPDTGVVLLLAIGPDGTVRRCEPSPFGAILEYETLCNHVASIARFEPATNAAGAPVEDHYIINIVSWRKYAGGEFEHTQSEVAEGTPPVPAPAP